MADYQLTWLTNQLAVGYAPMSYAELDNINRLPATAGHEHEAC